MCRWHIATGVDPSRSEGESLIACQKNLSPLSDGFFCYVYMMKEIDNPKFPVLSSEVRRLKDSEGGVLKMSTIMEELFAEFYADELKESKQKGLQEGRQEGALEMIIGLVKDKILSVEDAAARVNMPVAELAALLEK